MPYKRVSGSERRAEKRARGQYIFISKPLMRLPDGSVVVYPGKGRVYRIVR